MDDLSVQAERLLEIGRLDELGKLLERWISQEPHSAEAHQYRARLALAREDYAGCISAAREALSFSPRDATARFVLHLGHFGAEQYADAESVLLDLLREQPDDPGYLSAYARLMLCTLQVDKARALVTEALRLDPESSEARLVSVLLRLTEDHTAVAAEELEEVIAAAPRGEHTALVLLQVLVAQRRLREALVLGQELLRNNPTQPELVELVIQLRAQTHWAALPAYPQIRWGWTAVAVLWGLGVVGVPALLKVSPLAGRVALVLYIAWLVHSWTYQSILTRWIRARGVY